MTVTGTLNTVSFIVIITASCTQFSNHYEPKILITQTQIILSSNVLWLINRHTKQGKVSNSDVILSTVGWDQYSKLKMCRKDNYKRKFVWF